ncbi:hypothetical protein PQR39_36315 [Paraburkholderia sediminicola]|uniref:hypothetical protein n=1 Tax=Paraburkholderia sediminicola TaxID=458836 RepID=UPI0038B93569
MAPKAAVGSGDLLHPSLANSFNRHIELIPDVLLLAPQLHNHGILLKFLFTMPKTTAEGVFAEWTL